MKNRAQRGDGWWVGSVAGVVGLSLVMLTLFLLQALASAGEPASVEEPALGRSARARRSLQGWRTTFSETFESGVGPEWHTADWVTSAFTSVSGDWSAWSGGSEGSGLYTDSVDAWLVSGPIVLGGSDGRVWGAEVHFAWWLDTAFAARGKSRALGAQSVERVRSLPPSGDWFGWAVLTDATDLESGQWTYVSGATAGWARGSIPLEAFLPGSKGVTSTVHVAFHFVSDDDGTVGRGAFVDDVELRVNHGYDVALPLVVRASAPVPTSTIEDLLTNGGFEADWGEEQSHRVKVFPVDGAPYVTELGEFHTPPGWLSWFRHDPGVWDQPEVGDIRRSDVAYRVRGGEKAARLFTFYRRHDAGFMQQVAVEPGSPLTLTAHAHAWSYHPIPGHEDCTDNGRCSTGVGEGGHFLLPEDIPPLSGDPWNDAVGNFAFQVGIDPTGGTDPFANTVDWGTEAYIYNAYYQVPVVTSVAEAQTATVFLRSHTLWPFKHNDAYWDDVALLGVRGAPNPPPGPTPEPGPWNYPVIATGSKVGVHAIRSNEIRGFAQDLADAGARFPVVKAVDDFGWLQEIEDISPDTIFVGRRTWLEGEGCQGVLNWSSQEMVVHAEEAIARILSKIAVTPGLGEIVDYWEPYNEPDPPGAEGYRQLAELMKVTMDVAEVHGLKLGLFSLNAGTPEWDEMQAMVETGVFSRAREGGHILALHEGTFDSHDPRQYWPSKIPPADEVPDVEGAGALNFRYRYLYYLLKQRDEVVPLVVSEWYCGDEQSASTQTLVDALTWYDGEASKDYYFWATCPFTLGPSAGWGHTDYERVYEGGLVDYMIEIRHRQNATLPGRTASDTEPWLLRLR